MLRVKYGWAGEGKFWALNNRIAESENCELNLTKKYNKASIANDLDFTLKEFDDFLEYLTEDCDLIVKENNIITTEIVREILLKVMKERTRNKNNYDKRVIQDVNKGKTQSKHVESKIQHVENIQRKGKERKEKEIKEVYKNAIQVLIYLKSKVKWMNINPEQENKKFLLDRLKDGISVEDCKAVIDIKFKDDHFKKNNFKFMKCSTLFRKSKFQNYLEEVKSQKQTKEQDDDLYG